MKAIALVVMMLFSVGTLAEGSNEHAAPVKAGSHVKHHKHHKHHVVHVKHHHKH